VAAAAAAISIYDVDRLLWVPGERRIFLPPLSEWMTVPWTTEARMELFLACIQMPGLMAAELKPAQPMVIGLE